MVKGGDSSDPLPTSRTSRSVAASSRSRSGGVGLLAPEPAFEGSPRFAKTTDQVVVGLKEEGDFVSSLEGVLRNKQMTTLTVFTSTVVGGAVGLGTMSGLLGSVAYMVFLAVQLVCAALSRMTKERSAPRRGPPVLPAPVEEVRSEPVAETLESGVARTALPKEWVLEPRTKHKYSQVMDEHDGYPEELELLSGLGIRPKRVIALTIDVYAVGMYVNAPQFKAAFGAKYGALSEAAFAQRSEELLEDIITSTERVGRTMRLVIQFSGITSRMLISSFDEKLEKPMKSKGAEEEYEALRRGLGSIKLHPGRVILLRMGTDGTLVATSGGETLANCQSHVLCQAVTDIWLGRDSPAPSFREDAKTRMYGTLHSPLLGDAEAAAPAAGSTAKEAQQKGETTELGGTWEVVDAEGVEEFLVTLGISYLVRKIATRLYTQDMKIIEQKGKTVSFTDFRNRRRGSPVTFEEDVVVQRQDKQGKDLEDVSSWEGPHLIVKTTGYKDVLTSNYWRESADTMISETTVKDVTMRRKWKLMDL